MTGSNSYSQKISELQAEGLGFRNFAWLGSNPSYAPVLQTKEIVVLEFYRCFEFMREDMKYPQQVNCNNIYL